MDTNTQNTTAGRTEASVGSATGSESYCRKMQYANRTVTAFLLGATKPGEVTRAVALIEERDNLRDAVTALLDDVNRRYPDKDPLKWRCPHMERLAALVAYSPNTKLGKPTSD